MNIDASGWSTRLDAALVREHSASGKWSGVTLRDCAVRRVAESPDAVWLVDGDVRLTFGQALADALTLATALRERGLAPGDVVSFQLPNWHETGIINLACAIGGFVCNPIVPIYRDTEVGFILADSKARVLFVPESFRGFDYRAMCDRLRPAATHLEHVIHVRSETNGGDTWARWTATSGAPLDSFPAVAPDAVKLLLYTSGTTGHPKGVLHSHNTLRADIDATLEAWAVTTRDVVFMPSPVTHITGYLYALEMPMAIGIPAVMMDRWHAVEAVSLIEAHGTSIGLGATPFLMELVAEADRQQLRLPTMRMYASGGAPVPPAVVRRANVVLPNCRTFRAYGSSEAPSVTLGPRAQDPAELGATTDGFIFNHEVRIVDHTSGAPLPDGQEGEILTRGPEVMLGYTNPEHTREAFDDEGFFRTGDLGVISRGGYLTITGRKKDLIIRGGENLSAKEIEDALHQHPAVREAAVVAMPHERMGETPCAYVVLEADATLELDAMRQFLDGAKLARQKFPERLFFVDTLPRNAAGKVLKEQLRRRVVQDMKAVA